MGTGRGGRGAATSAVPDALADALAGVVAREPFEAGDGKSNSRMELLRLADGRCLVVKHVVVGGDWLSRATEDDHGRVAALWRSGLLDELPADLDHAIVRIDAEPGGWAVVMRDVRAALVGDAERVSRARGRRILAAAAALHRAFADPERRARFDPTGGLCPLAARYSMLSPATAARERGGADEVPKLLDRGWARFFELVDGDVGRAVAAILERPAGLADALGRHRQVLVHGDLKLGNLGLLGDRVVALDWGTQTGWAPPAVEWAWYLAINASRIDATRDELLDDVRAASGDLHDEGALRLALLGGLVQLGWDKALHATGHPDPAVRARESADLAWWVGRARLALEHWSP
jgi:hypothetical protein